VSVVQYIVQIDASDATHIRGTVTATGATRSFVGWMELISTLERDLQPTPEAALADRTRQGESE
jgi:hypothetical protein